MKILLMLFFMFVGILSLGAADGFPEEELIEFNTEPQNNKDPFVLKNNGSIKITVQGQGVAPSFTTSPAQAYALAKRAATADAYRIIAERIKGVYVEGKDSLKNMMVKSSTVNLSVQAMIRNATVLETTFENGLCEVEMEIELDHSQFE